MLTSNKILLSFIWFGTPYIIWLHFGWSYTVQMCHKLQFFANCITLESILFRLMSYVGCDAYGKSSLRSVFWLLLTTEGAFISVGGPILIQGTEQVIVMLIIFKWNYTEWQNIHQLYSIWYIKNSVTLCWKVPYLSGCVIMNYNYSKFCFKQNQFPPGALLVLIKWPIRWYIACMDILQKDVE